MMAGQEAMAAAFQAEHNRRLQKSKDTLTAYAAEMGNHMRQHAPWTDRTGNARASLRGATEFTDEVLKLFAVGGGPPDYVVYLELCNAGRYAIIRPTLEVFAGPVYKELVRIWTT